jgi:hypothetical protein
MRAFFKARPCTATSRSQTVCEQTAGRVWCGSIDEPAQQKSIIDIMEGGKEAFDKRKEIYQIWKS